MIEQIQPYLVPLLIGIFKIILTRRPLPETPQAPPKGRHSISEKLKIFRYTRSRPWTSHTMTTRSPFLPAGSFTKSSNTALAAKPAFLKTAMAAGAWR